MEKLNKTQKTSETTTQNNNNLDNKKDNKKVALLNYKNSEVFSLFFDNSITKLETIKNFKDILNDKIDTNILNTFCNICVNLIFNDAVNSNANKKIYKLVKNNFIKISQNSSNNFLKSILYKAYLTSFNNAGLTKNKEYTTETTCTKQQNNKISILQFFKSAILSIITNNGQYLVQFDSIKNDFVIVDTLNNEIDL